MSAHLSHPTVLRTSGMLSSSVLLCLLIVFSLSVFVPVHASDISKEDKIKASYVFNFIRFIKWPKTVLDNNAKPINVCAINRNNHFSKAFQPVISKVVNGHPLEFHRITNIEQVSHCHLIYIDQAEKNNLDNLLPIVNKHKILSISDIKTFCAQGGIIGMVNKKGKIRVEINLDVAREAGFKISSNLLEVATIVSSQ